MEEGYGETGGEMERVAAGREAGEKDTEKWWSSSNRF